MLTIPAILSLIASLGGCEEAHLSDMHFKAAFLHIYIFTIKIYSLLDASTVSNSLSNTYESPINSNKVPNLEVSLNIFRHDFEMIDIF